MHAPHCDYLTTQFAAISSLQTRLTKLEDTVRKLTGAPSSEAPPPVSNDDDDDDFDLFGSDDEGSKVEKPVETKKKSKSEFLILLSKNP